MTEVTEDAAGHTNPVRLLVWDDPDMRARLADVLVTDVAPGDAKPDLERVYLWLAGRCQPGEVAEACLFTAVAPGQEETAAAEVTKVRLQGFAVLARPRPPVGDAGLPVAMWAHIDRLADAGRLVEVIVACHDAVAFGNRLAALAGRGVDVTVVGFRERASFAVTREGVTFFDLEEVPGAFGISLPRTNLYDLPSEGRALPPLRRPELPALNRAPVPMVVAPSGSDVDLRDAPADPSGEGAGVEVETEAGLEARVEADAEGGEQAGGEEATAASGPRPGRVSPPGR